MPTEWDLMSVACSIPIAVGAEFKRSSNDGTARLAHQPRDERMPPGPQSMRKPMHRHGVESGIEKQHRGDTSGRGVAFKDGLNILAEPPPETEPPSPGPFAPTLGCGVWASHGATLVSTF